MDADTVYQKIRATSGDFAAERRERQQRPELVAADFAQLRDAGFLLTGVPVDHGGVWESVSRSTRPICEMLRTLAHGDSSVALVCAMHPAVLNFWMATTEAPAPFDKAWDEQRRSIFRNVRAGAWWGTIASEPRHSRRHRQDKGHGATKLVRWRLPAHRTKEFWQRVWGHLLHDHRS